MSGSCFVVKEEEKDAWSDLHRLGGGGVKCMLLPGSYEASLVEQFKSPAVLQLWAAPPIHHHDFIQHILMDPESSLISLVDSVSSDDEQERILLPLPVSVRKV